MPPRWMISVPMDPYSRPSVHLLLQESADLLRLRSQCMSADVGGSFTCSWYIVLSPQRSESISLIERESESVI
jgi:hypothetical protein